MCSNPSSGADLVVFLQDASLKHQYIRSRDVSTIVERPERVRAVKAGLAVALSRLEGLHLTSLSSSSSSVEASNTDPSNPDDLAKALNQMTLETSTALSPESRTNPVQIIHSTASVDILNNPAVKFVHGDVDGDVYLENLRDWVANSINKISKGESEIPSNLSQGDLYLCPGSLDAIQGALGTVCEAVDAVVSSTGRHSLSAPAIPKRAFCVVRPPGHHCGEDTPCGFCFVNNVAVAAAHAHLKHKIRKVVIFDIDLHHGNGTQAIAWGINEEYHRKALELESSPPDQVSIETGLQIYYGSLHDILSFPCEDGKPELVQAASVSIQGPHGQYIENIHLEKYSSTEDFFDRLYEGPYKKLLTKAEQFVGETGGSNDDTLVFISCGFDACEHEYASMSRHGRTVPVEFYHRFTRDACALADRIAGGRIISLLEGGYSDRALISGAIAHVAGFTDVGAQTARDWWSPSVLQDVEKSIKKRRGGRRSNIAPLLPWLDRAIALLDTMDGGKSVPKYSPPAPALLMKLRERKQEDGASGTSTPREASPDKRKPSSAGKTEAKEETVVKEDDQTTGEKKIRRVILKVGPPPSE